MKYVLVFLFSVLYSITSLAREESGTLEFTDSFNATKSCGRELCRLEVDGTEMDLGEIKLFDLSVGQLEEVHVEINSDFLYSREINPTSPFDFARINNATIKIELDACGVVYEFTDQDLNLGPPLQFPVGASLSGVTNTSISIDKNNPALKRFIDSTVSAGADNLTTNCQLSLRAFVFDFTNTFVSSTVLARYDWDVEFKVSYDFVPKDLDISAQDISYAQNVFDPTLSSSDVTHLVQGKEAMGQARIFLDTKDQVATEILSDIELEALAEIELQVGSQTLLPEVVDGQTTEQTLNNILLNSLGEGHLVRFFFQPESGSGELTANFPDFMNVTDSDPQNNIARRSIIAEQTNPFTLEFIAINDCVEGGCFSNVSTATLNQFASGDTDFVNKLFPVADGAIQSSVSTVPVTGSSDTTPFNANFTQGLMNDLNALKIRAHLSFNQVDVVGIVAPDYFARNVLDDGAATIGLQYLDGRWPSLVAGDQVGFGILAHELAHKFFGTDAHSEDTPNLAYDASERLEIRGRSNFLAAAPGQPDSNLWLNKRQYEDLITELKKPPTPDPQVVVVSGFINQNGTVDLDQVIISEQGIPSVSIEGGDTQFTLVNSNGQTLSTITAFPPRTITVDSSVPGAGRTIDISARRPFVEAFVLPNEPFNIVIEQNGQELISIPVDPDSSSFAQLIEKIEGLEDNAFRVRPDRAKKRLLRVVDWTEQLADNGKEQKAIQLLNRKLRWLVKRLILSPDKEEVLSILDGLIESLREGLETAQLRELILDSDDSIFRRYPKFSRHILLRKVNHFQKAIDQKMNYARIVWHKKRLKYLIKHLVKREHQESFLEALNTIFLQISADKETSSISEELVNLPSKAFKSRYWYGRHYLLSKLKSIQKDIDRNNRQKALYRLKILRHWVKKRLSRKYRKNLNIEINKLILSLRGK